MLAATDLSEARIGQISINVHDLERAVAFLQREAQPQTSVHGSKDEFLRLRRHPFDARDS